MDDLLQRNPQRAKVEILKHLDGDLVIEPRPPTAGEQRAEISGCAKTTTASLVLRRQFTYKWLLGWMCRMPHTTPETFWVDAQ